MRQQSSSVVRVLLLLPTLCGMLVASLPLDGRTCDVAPTQRSCCQSTSPGESTTSRCCGCCPSVKSTEPRTQLQLNCHCRASEKLPATPERPSNPVVRLRVMATDIVEFACIELGRDGACVARLRRGLLPPLSERCGGLLVKNCVWQI